MCRNIKSEGLYYEEIMKKIHLLKSKKMYIVVVALWVLLCLLATPVYTSVTVNFAQDPSGEAVTTIFTSLRENVTSKGARARTIYEGVAHISFYDIQYGNHCSIKRIDPVDENWQREELLTISDISVSKNGIPVWKVSGEKLSEYFIGNDQVSFQDSEEGLAFYVLGNDPQLIPTEKFENEFISSGRVPGMITGSCYTIVLWMAAYVVCKWFAKELEQTEDTFGKMTYWLFFAGILGAVCMCIYMGTRSPFWLNPDEYEVRSAVRYYTNHWFPPDIRSDEISDAFAVYGTCRHSEWNTFYFWAGKLGQFFADAALRSRWLNLSLMVIMAGIILKNCRKQFALLFVLLLTPQVWYIFSYTTSDGLDFFWGFLAVYELMKEDSLLNRSLREPISKKKIPGYLLISLLFVNLFWAKISFYPVLLFLFLILLIRLFDQQGEERKSLFGKYLLFVGITFGIFAVRYMITDFPYYGFDKYHVINEVMELRATYEYKPSTPPLEQAGSIYLYQKGVPLSLFFGEMQFNKNLFRTFTGFFGNYHYGMADWYYTAMAILYIALIVCLIRELFRENNRKKWLEFLAVAGCMAVQYLLIFMNGYFVDFQPQGRYMLPALLYVSYLVYTCKEGRNSKVIRLILCATCVLSLYAFLSVGITNMIPLNTTAIY